MDSFLGSLFNTLLAPVMNHITKHATYPFKVGGNVRDLETTTSKLEARMNDISKEIESAERLGLKRKQQVESWLKQVKAIIAETNDIKEEYSNRSNRSCSLNCWLNYSIGKRAARKLLAAQNLYKDGEFQSVALELSPTRIQGIPSAFNESGQVDPNLQTALDYLNNGTVTTIGIHGMGGVGKTRLLKQIEGSFLSGHSIFCVVIFVTASRECSVEKVQDEIIQKLRLKESNDIRSKANTIFNFLTGKSFLLLVDDLWEYLDLDAVGIKISTPTTESPEKRKMVLTTRSIDVCTEMAVEQKIIVNELDALAAWNLFQENVGGQTHISNPAITNLAKEIVKELAGLPLALIIIGKAMKDRKHYRAWEDMVEQLKESRFEEGTKIFHKLKGSYENLPCDTLKQCFLSCSMWPKDYEISKEELIQCWIALGLVKVERTLRSAYNGGYTLIEQLRAACLLESTGYDDRESVKMNGMIREMALWVARDYGQNNNKWIVKAKFGTKVVQTLSQDICEKTERISLMMNRLVSLPFPNIILPSNKLTSLFLQINSLPGTTLGLIRIFQSLTYLDLYDNKINEFPVEICKLVKLQYLNLGRNEFGSLPKELKSLTNLKYLHLRDNRIHTVPKGVFSELNALQVLDLFNRFSPGSSNSTLVIANLTSLLEELKNNLRALGITAAGESQFQLLQRSTDLPIQFIRVHSLRERTLSLTTNFFGSLEQFELSENRTEQILIEKSGLNANSHLYLERFCFYGMVYLDTIVWKGVSPRDLFPKLRHLQFSACDKLKNVSWIVHLQCLWELMINDCDGMEYVISSTEDNHGENSVAEIQEEGVRELIPTFPCLEIIKLESLPVLHAICDSGVIFPSLRYLKLNRCPKLKKLPFQPHNIPSKLEKIECQRSTWEAFEWDDDNLRDSLQKICTLVAGESQLHLLQRSADLPLQSSTIQSLKEPTLSLTTNDGAFESVASSCEIASSYPREAHIQCIKTTA